MKRSLVVGFLTAAAVALVAAWNLPAVAWFRPDGGDPVPTKRACTSFCLSNAGQAVFGANYDNAIWEGLLFVNKRGVSKTGYEAGTTGRYARWTSRYGSVSFNLAGVQMAWAGMNEAGLVISTMWLGETRNPPPDERPPLVSALWVQYQLDTCATVQDVVANDNRVRIAGTLDHYLICDRSGACAAVEFLEGRTVFHTGGSLPVRALANSPYLTSATAWSAGQLAERERFRIAADRVTGFKGADPASAVAYAFDILGRVSSQPSNETPTQWSIVFDVANGRIHWRTSRNAQERWVDFSKLDFACGTPVEMLDVHAPLSGDITGRLGRYNYDTNLQNTLSFLRKWGQAGLSELEVEVLERGVETFACAAPGAPLQEEEWRALPPVAGWAVRAILHRYWPVLLVTGAGIAALVLWRGPGARRARLDQGRIPCAQGMGQGETR